MGLVLECNLGSGTGIEIYGIGLVLDCNSWDGTGSPLVGLVRRGL